MMKRPGMLYTLCHLMHCASRPNVFRKLASLVGAAPLATAFASFAAPLQLPPTGQFTMLQGTVAQALDQFCADVHLRASIAPSLVQPVRKGLTANTPQGFLDRITTEYHLDWYFDGETLFVTPSQETVSRDVALDGISYPAFMQALKERQIADTRFPVHLNPDGQHISVFGPPRLAQLINQTIAAMNDVRSEGITIYRGSAVQKLSPQ